MSARPGGCLGADGLSTAEAELTTLWAQLDVAPVTTNLVLAAARAGQAAVVATADGHLLAAAQPRQLDVAGPQELRAMPALWAHSIGQRNDPGEPSLSSCRSSRR